MVVLRLALVIVLVREPAIPRGRELQSFLAPGARASEAVNEIVFPERAFDPQPLSDLVPGERALAGPTDARRQQVANEPWWEDEAAAGVGGHYYEGMDSDPWTTTYTSDSSGAAQISLPMTGFSLTSSMPVLGRTLVVHSASSKIGCGALHLLEQSFGALCYMAPFLFFEEGIVSE